MKALFIITGLFPGGAEKIVLETVRCLVKTGHHAAVVSLQEEPSPNENAIVLELEKLGVRPYFLNLSLLRGFRFLTLLRIIRKEAPDVVHSHLMHANLTARLARLFLRFPLVNTVHIAERRNALKIKILFLLDRLSVRLCDVYTAVSNAAARFHEQQCGLPAGTLRTVYNGSDRVEPKPEPELAELCRQWGLDGVRKRIGSIGRLDHQKGYDIFLRGLVALRPLIPAGERWGVLLIGDGPERTALERIAEEMERELPEIKIVLPGYRPDAASLLPMLDLFVMPSRYEGFGLALTEALSLGIPALCSMADSLPELCAMSPENTLTADFTTPDMTEIYRRALKLPRLNGQVFQSTEKMAEEYLALYREISRK